MIPQITKGPSGRIHGLRNLLSGLTRDDVLGVLAQFTLESASQFGFVDSTDYDLFHDGRAHPPKAVLGLAAAHVIGRPLTSDEFAGGEKSACFGILKSLGFNIRKKANSTLTQTGAARLVRYARYEREQVAHLFEPTCKYTAGAGRWGISGIVENPKDSGDFVFFVTLGKPREGNPYQDALTEDGFLIWESQTRHSLESAVVRKLISHDPLLNNIHLFLRQDTEAAYLYMGLLEYSSHDENTSKPVHFVWRIRDWDSPEEDLRNAGVGFKKAIDPAYSPPKDDVRKVPLRKVDPPAQLRNIGSANATRRKRSNPANQIDWATQDERNRRLGLEGEKLVLQYEIEKLKSASRQDLADQVTHVALYDSTAGFDIRSFAADGTEMRIEVKTTRGPSQTPFFISVNEVLASREDPESYWVYRVFDLGRDKEHVDFFELNGDVEECCELVPVTFRAFPK